MSTDADRLLNSTIIASSTAFHYEKLKIEQYPLYTKQRIVRNVNELKQITFHYQEGGCRKERSELLTRSDPSPLMFNFIR